MSPDGQIAPGQEAAEAEHAHFGYNPLVYGHRLGLLAGTALAFLELRWKFLAPVLVGDTIHARVVVGAKREVSKPDRGIVTFAVTLFNQRGEPVQEGEHTLLLARNANTQARNANTQA